jgi:hypothetical protein
MPSGRSKGSTDRPRHGLKPPIRYSGKLCVKLSCFHKRKRSSPKTFGRLPERPKGADCKSAGTAYGGSNPSSATAVPLGTDATPRIKDPGCFAFPARCGPRRKTPGKSCPTLRFGKSPYSSHRRHSTVQNDCSVFEEGGVRQMTWSWLGRTTGGGGSCLTGAGPADSLAACTRPARRRAACGRRSRPAAGAGTTGSSVRAAWDFGDAKNLNR